MSRIGKQIINIPAGVSVALSSGELKVKGPLGELNRLVRKEISFQIGEKEISLTPIGNGKFQRALWGTYAAHLKNMIAGVTKLYEQKLLIEGVGYKWEIKGNQLTLSLGFSHLVHLPIPSGLTVSAEKNALLIKGIDKELVSFFASKVRLLKKPEPYKGKGIRYEKEVVRRKQGKKSA